MGEELEEDFPLFPLGIVAIPTEVVPLHIFEERYKQLIQHCLEDDALFGIVHAGSSGLSEIGCTCEVTAVLERSDDGRMNILTRGLDPFELLETTADEPFPRGEIRVLHDGNGEIDPRLLIDAQTSYCDLVERVTGERPDVELLGLDSAYALAATIEFGNDSKLKLLGTRSEAERLSLLIEMIDEAAKMLKSARLIEARARTNGKVSLGDS